MTDDKLNPPSFFRLAFSDGTPIKALKVSLLVGTTLTLINQWQMIIGHHTVDMFCLTCTFIVPYLVVTFTVVRETRLNFSKKTKSTNASSEPNPSKSATS